MVKRHAVQPPARRGQSLTVGDVELHYEEYGTGAPLVLLHGFGGSSQNWAPFVAELALSHRLIVIDLRGHGHSTNPKGVFTHGAAAKDVLLLLDAIGIERCSAIGLSTGAMVLLHIATLQPRRIVSMVLVSATSHFPDQARTIMRAASFERMPPPVQAMYRECAKRGDGQVRQLIAQFNALHRDYDDMNFDASRLATIQARTLVVHGDRDRFFPVEIAVDLYRAIGDAALWIVPEGDHVPVYDPAVPFIATALRFLAGPANKGLELG